MKHTIRFIAACAALSIITGCAATQQDTSMNNTTERGAAAQAVQAVMHTSQGDITLELFAADAPNTVANFTKLASEGFYNGTQFHRVIKDFMIQGGDPLSKNADISKHGTGGPGYEFDDEINQHKLVRGVLAMANRGPNTNGSQFFIITAPATPWLDGKHAAFGRVTKGMDVVSAIEAVATDRNDHPIDPVIVNSIDIK